MSGLSQLVTINLLDKSTNVAQSNPSANKQRRVLVAEAVQRRKFFDLAMLPGGMELLLSRNNSRLYCLGEGLDSPALSRLCASRKTTDHKSTNFIQ